MSHMVGHVLKILIVQQIYASLLCKGCVFTVNVHVLGASFAHDYVFSAKTKRANKCDARIFHELPFSYCVDNQ